jgi:protein phosphatase
MGKSTASNPQPIRVKLRQPMKVVAWGLTDAGKLREHNEDSVLIDLERQLFAVADGMGGHAGGERASGLAVELIEQQVAGARPRRMTRPIGISPDDPAGRLLREATESASKRIYELASAEHSLAGMGTTLTALLVDGGRAYLAHVGDSRAYLLRDNRLRQLTADHSWIEEQVRAGNMSREEADQSRLRHVVTRSVGFERDVHVDLVAMPVVAGDCFLLCTDGLSNYFRDEELASYLSINFFADVPRLLVQEANARGGEDNLTVIVVYLANQFESAVTTPSSNR